MKSLLSKTPTRVPIKSVTGDIAYGFEGFLFKGGYIVLLFFAFMRPMTLTLPGISLGSLSAFQLFAIGISYLLILMLLANFRFIHFDRIALLVLSFCMFCCLSILLGAQIQWISRVVLPFLLFFSVKTFVVDQKKINGVLIALALGYIVPIVLSTYSIGVGNSLERVDFMSKVARHRGVFYGTHTLAYSMLFYSFLYGLMIQMVDMEKRWHHIAAFGFLISSIFCLYKSYTRTALVGLAIFWSVYLWSDKRKFVAYFLLLLAVFTILMPNELQKVFFKTENTENADLNAASSGRLDLWQHNIEVFLDSDILVKLLGNGIGVSKGLVQRDTDIVSSHNDYLELLMSVGIIGLSVYLLLMLGVLNDIRQSTVKKKHKLFFLAVFLSIIAMQFLSNAIVFRTECSQMFWLFMGLFYSMANMGRE